METASNNFYDLISEKTEDFVGREWVFNEIDNWLNDDSQNHSKYFIITGKAGSGKSTIAARLIEISKGVIERNRFEKQQDIVVSDFKKIKKNFLNAFYVISFNDNLSTDTKTFSTSIASQLGKNNSEFAIDLVNSTKTSNTTYINASQQQIQANTVYGATFNIDIDIQIYGSPPALSVFNDLVRTPLESYLKKNPEKRMVFLIDGLDESITSSYKEEENYSDSIISILSNLQALKNVDFIITTNENVLDKFKKNSLILDISSSKYINYVNDDIYSYINKLLPKKSQTKPDKEKLINQLVEKAEGNFLYIKFVMDAVVEGKINFSEEEINKIPSGLFNIYNDFFVRMREQYGKNNWKANYSPVLRILLVSFEGLEANQITFFTGIEREDLQEILINLTPFIVEEKFYRDKNKNFRYKLYHQSLVEFFKKEFFDDDSKNDFFISEQTSHRKIVEKYYDDSKDEFKINLLKKNGYGLRYLPDHLFALIDYDENYYDKIDWYQKILDLAKNKEFEEKQIEYFYSETDLPLKTIKRAFEASLKKDDPLSTVEMLLLYSYKVTHIVKESPLSVLRNLGMEKEDNNDNYIERNNEQRDNDKKNQEIIEKALRIADLYDKETYIIWYLLVAWLLNSKDKVKQAKKTLERLLEKELVPITKNKDIFTFLIFSLYDCYKDTIVKIFDYLSDDNIYQIYLAFIEKRNGKIGLEIFNYVKNKNSKISALLESLNKNNIIVESPLLIDILERYATSLHSDSIKALSSIAQSLAESNRLDDASRLFDKAIAAAKEIDDSFARSQALSSIAQSLAQSNNIEEAISTAKEIDNGYHRSQALSSISQSLAQSNNIEKAISTAKEIDDSYTRSQVLSGYTRSEVLSEIIKMQIKFKKSYSKDLLDMINVDIDNNLYNIAIHSLNASKELWNYIIKQCLNHPTIAYSICSLFAQRHPKYSKEIADLILIYNF